MASRPAHGLCRRGHASQPLRLDLAPVDRRKRRGCPRCAREAPLAAGRARAALPNVRHKRPPRCFSTPFIVRPAEVGKYTCSAAERPSACVRVASGREACAMWAELSECVGSRVVVCASSECTWAASRAEWRASRVLRGRARRTVCAPVHGSSSTFLLYIQSGA